MKHIIVLLGLVTLAGCGDSRERQSVWETYDVRYPVPAELDAPYNSTPGYYIDNDAYYSPPGGRVVLCSGTGLGGQGCE